MSLGQRIRTARKARGLSLEKLGDKLGLSRQAVWQWESGETSPTRKNVEELSKILEKPVEFFYSSDAKPAGLEAKVGFLTPEERAVIEATVDALLAQRPKDVKRRVK